MTADVTKSEMIDVKSENLSEPNNATELEYLIEPKSELEALSDTDTQEIVGMNDDNSSMESDVEGSSNSNLLDHKDVTKGTNSSVKSIPANNETRNNGEANKKRKLKSKPQPKMPCEICGKLYTKHRLKFHMNEHNGKWSSLNQSLAI